MADPTPSAPAEDSTSKTNIFDFGKVAAEKGFWAAVALGGIYLLGQAFKSKEAEKLGGKAARVTGEVFGEAKDTLFDEDAEVSEFGRTLQQGSRRFIRDQAAALRRERTYRQRLGFWGWVRRTDSLMPAWMDTLSNAHTAKNRRPRRPGFMSRLGDAIISRIRRSEGGSAS